LVDNSRLSDSGEALAIAWPSYIPVLSAYTCFEHGKKPPQQRKVYLRAHKGGRLVTDGTVNGPACDRLLRQQIANQGGFQILD
jgi:hypothetical protein